MSEGKVVGSTIVTILMILGVIVACILVFFGVLFIWGAFSPEGSPGWITIGVITVIAGLVILAIAAGLFAYLRYRKAKAEEGPQEIIQKIDFTGDVELEKMKCQNCGGVLDKDNITVEAGAVFVACPYCGVSYQVVEEPKW